LYWFSCVTVTHRRQSCGVGGRDSQILGWGRGGRKGGSWTGLGKHYSLFL